ncbi:GntR family transcriptional regulator [Salinactinospora qingdaonensis]|uniref:GntR family transcriptional regulator n=1 Tax=Salinactinospora qingdaonensis TaxID=702744 RepID=A0ABP7F3N9_9ACTN
MDVTRSAAERVYQHAKNAILTGRYPAGDLISEGDIAADVGFSRTPVREALLRLETDGLVRLYPKRGALIVPVSQQEIDDVVETRRLIEGFTARRAAEAVPETRRELAERLDHHLTTMRREAGSDRSAFVLADREFHRAVVTATGNRILSQLYESLRDRQLRMMQENARTVARLQHYITEHAAILDAVRAGAPDAADAAVNAHLDTAAAAIGARR